MRDSFCNQPVYAMKGCPDMYRALSEPKSRLVRCPYPVAYFGGLRFGIGPQKKLPVSSIWVQKFYQNIWFSSARAANTGSVLSVSLLDRLSHIIHYEFVDRVSGISFQTE